MTWGFPSPSRGQTSKIKNAFLNVNDETNGGKMSAPKTFRLIQ